MNTWLVNGPDSWSSAVDPAYLLYQAGACWGEQAPSHRKWLLVACACCRLVWNKLTSDERMRVQLAEQRIEKLVRADLLIVPSSELSGFVARGYPTDHLFCSVSDVAGVRLEPAEMTRRVVAEILTFKDKDRRKAVCNTIRDVIQHPATAPSKGRWFSDRDVRLTARSIYEDNQFDELPVLADALEDAGCNDKEVLKHCRSKQRHYRGCWVVDRIIRRK